MNFSLFSESGRFEVGLNYWASHAATEMWSNWNEEIIRKDLRTIHEYGFSLLRVFPRWDQFQPIQGLTRAGGEEWNHVCDIRIRERVLPDTPLGRCGIDETMMNRFEKFCDIAAENQLRLIVPILTGHMTARLFVPPALFRSDLYRDPLALKYEILFLRGFIDRLKHHPAIAAWESGNETNCLSTADENEAWVWSNLIHSTIHHADPSRPVIGISIRPPAASHPDPWAMESQREFTDLISVHPYAMWFKELLPDTLTGLRATHHAPLENKMLAEMSGKPSFVEETGTWRPQIGCPGTLAGSLRSILWNSWRENAHALLWWCAFDQTDLPFAPYDWNWAGLEHGVFTADHQAYPVAGIFQNFSSLQRKLPFALPPMKSEKKMLCLLADRPIGYAFGILARQAGLVFEYRHSMTTLEDADCYALPSCAARGGLSSRDWEALKAKVRGGATLYLSLDNCYLDRLSEVCGCEVRSRRRLDDRMTVDFGDFSLTCRRDYAFEFGSCGARVLACDQDGNAVFWEYSYGRGKVYTLAFPLEARLLESAGTFERGAYRLYERMFPVRRLFRPELETLLCSEHPFGDGRVALLLTNDSDRAVEQAFPLAVREQYSDGPDAEISGGVLRLGPNAGLLAVCAPND